MQIMRIDFPRIKGTDSTSLSLARSLWEDLQNNGFVLKYMDQTTLWESKQVIFETTTTTDPLAATQPWRIGFVIDGNGDNQLTAYLGTAETLPDTGGIVTAYSYKAVLIQGGTAAGMTRISPSRLYSYQLTISPRGVAILVWEQQRIEDMRYMGLLCAQRPVSCGGAVLTERSAPVFAVTNTNASGRLDDRFFYSVVRESDVNLPTLPSAVSSQTYKATGQITFNTMTRFDQNTPVLFNVIVNGHVVQVGQQNNDQCVGKTGNYNSYIGAAGSTAAMAQNLAAHLNAAPDSRVQKCFYMAEGDKLILIAKDSGTVGNGISYSTDNGYYASAAGSTLLGGGSGVAAAGTVAFTSQPQPGDYITLNGVAIQFVSTTPVFNQVQIGASLTATVGNLVTFLSNSNDTSLSVASYSQSGTSLVINHNIPGRAGNYYGIGITGSFVAVNPGSLSGGYGDDTAGLLPADNEISDRGLRYGIMLHHLPNEWEGPVTNDDGEYVLIFPFGFTTLKTAYTEEMDMIAVSKGPAYQGLQSVDINVYGENRQYTAFNSNFATRPDWVRVFVLSMGGGV